jgi:cobalt/nickel transport system permease protein
VDDGARACAENTLRAASMTRLDVVLDDLRSIDALAAGGQGCCDGRARDPRAALITTLLFLATLLSFGRYQVAALLPLALFPVALAARQGLPARPLLRLLALASPFALLVGIFNPLLDQTTLLVIAGIPISGGWVSFAAIVLRFALSAAAALVLVAGVGMHPLCAALARLGAPRVFTVQLLLLHRYSFVLAGEAQRLATARRLRAGGRPRLGLAAYAALLGQLLLRAVARARVVHQAMLARGFDGSFPLAQPWRWQTADTLFVLGWCGFFALARAVDLPQALGALVAGVAG